ncbi:hypothetical protein [Bradyrhizobium sp. DASA03120]|uniref:hypothetical protein n=1 Tax=Bradyrhizobium sp. SMVTL-02 TaxID=3395917 RepID=UPI003F7088B4
MNKLLVASPLRLPSAELLALLIAIASFLFGLLVPIYTDEVGWRFQARSAIDDGVDRSIGENCGPNTLAVVPLFIQPLRYASATVNLAFADPIFVRLTGVTFSLVWLTILWRLTGAIAQTTRERSTLRVLAFSLSSFGVLPFLLVLSRPEQPILLALTVSILVATGAWAQNAPDSGPTAAAGRAAIVVTCGALALGYHPKGIVYMPMFLLCAGLSSSRRASVCARFIAVAALVGLSAGAMQDFG